MNGRLSYKRLYENSLKTIDMLKGQISTLKNKSNRIVFDDEEETPYNTFVNMINLQVEKENKKDIWEESDFRDMTKLQSNNVGIVGESFIQNLCKHLKMDSNIDGVKTKKIGGGCGDGTINNKTIEIKTSSVGTTNKSFQHELGEKPWLADYMIFIDVEPSSIYLTVFKNFAQSHYMNGYKCKPIFPTKTVTQRKQTGAFKLDTTVGINEVCVKNGYSIKITQDTTFRDIEKFINNKIN